MGAMPRAEKEPPASRTDGRALRSERSRRKIVDALFELVGEGQLIPTAKQVAERATVGIRTVFRHFDDMDGLYAEMGERLRSEGWADLEVEPSTGTLEERAREMVTTRCAIFERISPFWRASEAQRLRSRFVAERREIDAAQLRDNLHAWMPELANAAPEIADAIEMISSPEAWHRLRVEQKLSQKRATAAVHHAVAAAIDALSNT
jgi:AcrR family transcriptional regulator